MSVIKNCRTDMVKTKFEKGVSLAARQALDESLSTTHPSVIEMISIAGTRLVAKENNENGLGVAAYNDRSNRFLVWEKREGKRRTPVQVASALQHEIAHFIDVYGGLSSNPVFEEACSQDRTAVRKALGLPADMDLTRVYDLRNDEIFARAWQRHAYPQDINFPLHLHASDRCFVGMNIGMRKGIAGCSFPLPELSLGPAARLLCQISALPTDQESLKFPPLVSKAAFVENFAKNIAGDGWMQALLALSSIEIIAAQIVLQNNFAAGKLSGLAALGAIVSCSAERSYRRAKVALAMPELLHKYRPQSSPNQLTQS